ncbi:MAG: GspE/PulE family protein [Verrucomicrobiota bacterium]
MSDPVPFASETTDVMTRQQSAETRVAEIEVGPDVDGYFAQDEAIPDFVSDAYHAVGLRALPLADSPYLNLENLVQHIHDEPLDFERINTHFIEAQGFYPISVDLSYNPSAPSVERREFVVLATSVYSEKRGKFKDPARVYMRLSDGFLGALQENFGYTEPLTPRDVGLVLLSPAHYRTLVHLSQNESERKRFLNELDDEIAGNVFYRSVMARAIKLRASDVHFEPLSHNEFRIRYRIDGKLHVAAIPINRSKFLSVISAMKIDANLNIAEKQTPQDGGTRYVSDVSTYGQNVRVPNVPESHLNGKTAAEAGGKADAHIALKYLPTKNPYLVNRGFRISTVPLIYDEKGVVRILPETKTVHVDKIGLEPEHKAELIENMQSPSGIVLITGPTGSGKTTTLSACLDYLNTPEINIMTIEDPAEIVQPGLNQSQVNRKKGWDFDTAMENFLRQDPDVIYLGEMRNSVTARMAVSAAKTGHLVVSTLHTNDAVDTPFRLIDLGVSPADMYSALLAIQAQRLVRKFIPYDERLFEFYDPADELNALLRDAVFKKGELSFCRPNAALMTDERQGFGYRGRVPIMEIWTLDGAAKEMLYQNRSNKDQYIQRALASGMRPMIVHGFERVARGETSVAEIRDAIPLADFRYYKDLIVSVLRK